MVRKRELGEENGPSFSHSPKKSKSKGGEREGEREGYGGVNDSLHHHKVIGGPSFLFTPKEESPHSRSLVVLLNVALSLSLVSLLPLTGGHVIRRQERKNKHM